MFGYQRNVINLGHTTVDTNQIDFIDKYISKESYEWSVRIHKFNGAYFDVWYNTPEERNFYYNKILNYL